MLHGGLVTMPNLIDLDSQLRFLLYSHDGLGLGHANRNLALAEALLQERPGASVLLATGTDELHLLHVPEGVGVLKLPGIQKDGSGRYAARRLAISQDDILRLRSSLLASAVESFRPNVVVVDKHPVGVNGELGPALQSLRARGGRAVLGLRDILDEPQAVRKEWSDGVREDIARYYEQVLVYGQQSVCDPIREYHLPHEIAKLIRFCGYVMRQRDTERRPAQQLPVSPAEGRTRPVVLATAGGGEDGFALLETFIESAVGASWDGIVVAGPHAPNTQRRSLHRLADEAGVAFLVQAPGLADSIADVDALVCMGGYNTIVEAVSSGTPTVCVPRTQPRTEQLIRATAFARLGLLSVVEPDRLDATTLRSRVAEALRTPRSQLRARAQAALALDGARTAGAYILALAEAAAARGTAQAGDARSPMPMHRRRSGDVAAMGVHHAPN